MLALIAAVLYGASDFFGALGTRRVGLVASTTLVHLAAAIVLLALWPLAPGTWTPGGAVAGTVAGALAVGGFLLFYAVMAIGPMSVLSPLIALVGAIVPVVAAFVLGERFGAVTITAIVAAVIAAVLVSIERGAATRLRPRTLLLALLAGVGLGGSLVAIDAAPAGSGLIPGEIEIWVGLLVLVALSAARRVRPRFDTTSLTGGALLGAANAGIVLALVAGELAIVSVLVCLYPVVTVVLATAVTRERMSRVQLAGIALAIAASVVLSLT